MQVGIYKTEEDLKELRQVYPARYHWQEDETVFSRQTVNGIIKAKIFYRWVI